MNIYSYIYPLRKFWINQEKTMKSYAIFIHPGKFQRLLNDSTKFQNLLKASIGMEKKIPKIPDFSGNF